VRKPLHFGPSEAPIHAHWGRMHRRFRRRRRPIQRALFTSFGFAILVAMGLSRWLGGMLPASHGAPLGHVLAYVAGGLALWGIAGAWAHKLVLPLRELSVAASELGAGKLSVRARVPSHGPSELIELGVRFNEMAARIESQVTRQHELLHAVSHELRTPLARLRVLLGILADGGTHPKLSADMEREVLELDQLVGELLANARIDGGALAPRDLSLRESVQSALARAGVPAPFTIPDHADATRADPTLLARALTLLIDNAQKHAGGLACITVERQGDTLVIEARDQGPGFAEAELARAFEPFARFAQHGADDGLGLGLYLLKRIAEAHGGRAHARNLEGGGAAVGFTLPRAGAAQGAPR
jgi:two-component system, OmpR family, sensor kinase